MKEEMKIISPIAIDMGAKNTGVYLNHFTQGEDPTTSGNIAGKTIVIDSSKITWSQVSRTQKRHQIRTSKRRKLAKRLFKLVLDEYGIKPNQTQDEYLNGLLNRRGYNRIETTEEQEEILQSKIVNNFFQPIIFGNNNNDGFLDRLNSEIAIKDEESKKCWKDVLSNKVFSLSGKLNSEFKEHIKDEYSKDEITELSKAFTAIKKLIAKQIDNYDTGHLHRKDYLEKIAIDIKNSKILKPLFTNDLTDQKLAYLIGNISNLQLRILRKYFNDKAMQSGDQWQPEELHKLFFRWVRGWHAKQDSEKQNRKDLLRLKNQDILDVFTTSNPELTIPPYEDQNNRRPPKDLTLRLKPAGLDKHLPKWQTITQSLADNYILPQIDAHITEKVGIAEKLKNNVRTQKYSNESEEKQILADTFHRILDRTTVLDPYKLRWLAQDSDTPEANDARELLNKHGNNQADNIVTFAKKYYGEVGIAKQGLWSDKNSLFFRCDTNPPHKGNIQHRLVGHILRCDFELNSKTGKSEKLEEFKEKCWNKKIKGNSTTKSLAGKIEETRKEYGNGFNYIVQTIKKCSWVARNKNPTQAQINRRDKYKADHKDVVEAIKKTDLVATEIDFFFNHNKKGKYNNPYSIAQLYNHLETEISGFSKTDKWNTEENAWRDKDESIEILNKAGEVVSITVASASRLTADSIRPFDGLLDRIISRQAVEIARMKIKQIEASDIDKNDTLFVPIFMEQNRFAFEQSLHEIKGLKNIKKKAKDRVEKGLNNQKTQWKDKDSRIKKNTICPYTGENISKGEIDHIIPQSESKKQRDVVFNSEANLIYCSSTGNNQKGDNRYTFEQLNQGYLTEIFGHANKSEIQHEIKNFMDSLGDNDSISFHNLEEKEQNYLRHALFIRELDTKTVPILSARYKTFVNGTQGYLGKQIRKLLQEKYPNVEVKTYQIPAQEVSQLRTVLGEYDENLKKQDKQGAFSHIADAALVLATALQSKEIAEELKTTGASQLSEHGEWLKNLLPDNADVQHIKRRPKYRKKLQSTQIFKEGLYGERFMPILLNAGKLYYGFSLNNCLEITPNKKQGLETLESYFELLKPFLYTGSTRKKNKKPVTGSLLDNQQQHAYLSIDKTQALSHLQKCAKEVCNDEEIKQAEQLEELRYSVEKKEIKSLLLTGQEKKSFVKQLDDKKFKVLGLCLPAKKDWERLISHPVKDYNGNETTLKECFGKSEQVEIDNSELDGFWENLANESGLGVDYLKDNLLKKKDKNGNKLTKQYFVSKKDFKALGKDSEHLKVLSNCPTFEKFGDSFQDSKDLIPPESWNKLFKELFLLHKPKDTTKYVERENRRKENRGNHHQVRKEYSLPIVSSPSGGFRIKRKNPLTGEAVYQVSGIEGFAAKGYDEALKTPVLLKELSDSPNIASLDGKQDNVETVCYFDEWRNIELTEELAKKITSLSYAIGSKDRFHIRVSMDFDEFRNLDETIRNFSNIPVEVKSPNKAKFLTYFAINNPKLPKDLKGEVSDDEIYKKLIIKDKKGKLKITDKLKFKKLSRDNKYLSRSQIVGGEYLKISLLGKPRSNLFVEKVSAEQIIFSYIVESTNNEMKCAYQKGTPIE